MNGSSHPAPARFKPSELQPGFERAVAMRADRYRVRPPPAPGQYWAQEAGKPRRFVGATFSEWGEWYFDNMNVTDRVVAWAPASGGKVRRGRRGTE